MCTVMLFVTGVIWKSRSWPVTLPSPPVKPPSFPNPIPLSSPGSEPSGLSLGKPELSLLPQPCTQPIPQIDAPRMKSDRPARRAIDMFLPIYFRARDLLTIGQCSKRTDIELIVNQFLDFLDFFG